MNIIISNSNIYDEEGNFCILDRSQDVNSFDPLVVYKASVIKTITDKRGKQVNIVRILEPCTYEKYVREMKILNPRQVQTGYMALFEKRRSGYDKIIKKKNIIIKEIPVELQSIIEEIEAITGEKARVSAYSSTIRNGLIEFLGEKIKDLSREKYFDTKEKAYEYASLYGLGEPRYVSWEEEWWGEVIQRHGWVVENPNTEKIQGLQRILDKLKWEVRV